MICAAVDLLECGLPDPAPQELLTAMREAASLLGVRVLLEVPVRFPNHGLTCVLVLAESHLTVSTWPEYAMAQVDLVSCRADAAPEAALRPLVELFRAAEARTTMVPRVDPRLR